MIFIRKTDYFFMITYDYTWNNKRFSMNLFEYHWILINITDSFINSMDTSYDLRWSFMNPTDFYLNSMITY